MYDLSFGMYFLYTWCTRECCNRLGRVGGGDTEDGYDTEYLIHEYHPIQEKWSTLPPAPVCWFGMGELNRNLVLVGGKTVEGFVTEKVHILFLPYSKPVLLHFVNPLPTCSIKVFQQLPFLQSGNSVQFPKKATFPTIQTFVPSLFYV